MNTTTQEFNCNEYLDPYYAFGLFHPTEAQELYPHDDMRMDEDKSFLSIGEIYDEHDLVLGYRKNETGIWGHYNRNYDGTFMYVSDSLKTFCEGWYQRNATYWCEMTSEQQWKEMSVFFERNMERYHWRAEKIKEFIDHCIGTQQLTAFYIKAYRTTIAITSMNSFSSRSFTNLVDVLFDDKKGVYIVYFKNEFFDHYPKSKAYENLSTEAMEDISRWVLGSE